MPLNDGRCAYLIARIADDLGLLDSFPEIENEVPPFFSTTPISSIELGISNPQFLYERLLTLDANTDTYFACLASLFKARLKYERILQTQPKPTFEQVGPRSLLQFGALDSSALSGLLQCRKWFFDIDNRAGQETGYLFEPIIANALGGTPAPSKKSPVRRSSDADRGRQVDCVLERVHDDGTTEKCAYEFKIRVTIAASGQGRWEEEVQFPADCVNSGYTPILICIDPTPNHRLTDLINKFEQAGGETYVGDSAWEHLERAAGHTMGKFLDRYVKEPMQEILDSAEELPPDMQATWTQDQIVLNIGSSSFQISRDDNALIK